MKSIKYNFLGLSDFQYFIVCALVLFFSYQPRIATAERFDPPSLKQPLKQFEARLDGDIFNVDFLLAHIINNSRKTTREVGDLVNSSSDILLNTEVFTNSVSNGSNAGSVVIPPGTSADTIIILNQNEGDSIAIQR